MYVRTVVSEVSVGSIMLKKRFRRNVDISLITKRHIREDVYLEIKTGCSCHCYEQRAYFPVKRGRASEVEKEWNRDETNEMISVGCTVSLSQNLSP